MSKIDLRQLNFNGGELVPALHARKDLEKYYAGVARAENMVMRPHGGAYKRPGTHCVAQALESAKPVRLIPFRFSVVQSYMLEFGDKRMRIIKDDALVAYPPGHAKAGQTVVIATPFAAADLERLTTAQTADLMYFAHPKYRLRKLVREDHHIWKFSEVAFEKMPVNPPTAVTLAKDGKNGAVYCVSALKSATQESLASDSVKCTVASGVGIPVPNYDALDISHCHQLWVVQYGQKWPAEWDFWGLGGETLLNKYLVPVIGFKFDFYENYGEPRYQYKAPDGKKWKHKVNSGSWAEHAINYTNAGYGGVLQGMRDKIKKYVEDFNAAVTATGISTLTWKASSGAKDYYVYRAIDSGSPFCYVGSTDKLTFTDDNLPVNVKRGPKEANNPFDKPEKNPGVCVFFEQRLVLARSDFEPCTFRGSRTGHPEDFSTHSPLQDDDCYNFTLDSNDMNEIHWALPLNEIIFGTSGGEWKAGGGGGAITPTNVNARVQSMYGCAPVPPVVVGRSAVFVGRSRRVLRDMSYSLENDGFDGDDLTIYASHLFENRTIAELCYQQEPGSVLWVVMSDGVLLSSVYIPNQRIVAWSRHETRGKFEGCASLVNIDGSDRVYFHVTRTINGKQVRFVEVMQDGLVPPENIAEAFYMDCGLSYLGEPTASLSGLGHLEGCAVDVLADGNHATAVVTKGRITLGHRASRVHVGLHYAGGLDTLALQPAEGPVTARTQTMTKVELTVEKTPQCKAGPQDRDGYEIIPAAGEGWPRLFSGTIAFYPEAPADHDGFRLRLVSDQPYPLCILAINAVGELGGQ